MRNILKSHSFHIPVMGTGFTIDSPVKVAHFGIASVISIGDAILCEKMRKFYCESTGRAYTEIAIKDEDAHARRIEAYLNLVHELVQENFTKLKATSFDDASSDIVKYFEMLPDKSSLKESYNAMLELAGDERIAKQAELRDDMYIGSIDVNIMTKVDKTNYDENKEPLPSEFNDGHASLRGYGKSTLDNSSIIFSAGMNPRLYGYIARFEDFFPDSNGFIKKKIVLKVSDYRSSLIQGKFLAKKGLWVSEYRIESGLNCGGHAFPTTGYLLGPILEEFKKSRTELSQTINEVLLPALEASEKIVPKKHLDFKITVQGGIGTFDEDQFLLNYYEMDGTGWATPFLLVPEATNVNTETLELLCKAKESELYLSKISPLGVPFNALRGTSKDINRQALVDKGRPGSSCPKHYLEFNTEFTDVPICSSSRQYQHLKIQELDSLRLPQNEYDAEFKKITNKTCLCTGLSTSAMIVNGIDTKTEGPGVAICPGPNMAYFSKVVALKEMVDHIYGKINLLDDRYRPNMFIKELKLYLDYLLNEIKEAVKPIAERQAKYFEDFKSNLLSGIEYYKGLGEKIKLGSEKLKATFNEELAKFETTLHNIEFPIAVS